MEFIDETVCDYEDTALTASLKAFNTAVPKFARKVAKSTGQERCFDNQLVPVKKVVVSPMATALLAAGQEAKDPKPKSAATTSPACSAGVESQRKIGSSKEGWPVHPLP